LQPFHRIIADGLKLLAKEEKKMKKVLIVLLGAILLAGCSLTGGSSLSDAQMSTRVAQLLTEMPQSPTETVLPTLQAFGQTPSSIAPTEDNEAAEVTSTPSADLFATLTPTATQPTPTPTETLTPTLLPTETATLTNTPQPTYTPPATDPRMRLGPPASTDPMNDEKTWNWPIGPQEFTAIEFQGGFMGFTGLKPEAGWRLPVTTAFSDGYVEMTVKTGTCSGKDSYGIIFRVPVYQEADRGYLFSISCDGYYRFTVWDGKEGENGHGVRLIDWRRSDYIITGSNQTNRVGVMAVGKRFYLFVNGYLLSPDTHLTDDTYPGGNFGVFVNAAVTSNFTIYVDEMSFWLNTFTP
jgi:hypothetical protein